MIIAIDIGNTNVTVGFLKTGQVATVFRFSTSLLDVMDDVAQVFETKSAKFLGRKEANEVFACSVVPDRNDSLRQICRQVFASECKIAGSDFCVPILNKYRIPSQVGQDRLVNAYAALKLYGKGLVIVDFGTAITFDIVSRKGEYLGGLIAPGLRLMQEALNKKTALLPFVELARPIEVIGRDTASSIRAGLVFGAAGLCDGILSRLLKKDCRGYKIVVTGGDAPLIQPHCAYLKYIEEHLILRGLGLIADSQKIRVKKGY